MVYDRDGANRAELLNRSLPYRHSQRMDASDFDFAYHDYTIRGAVPSRALLVRAITLWLLLLLLLLLLWLLLWLLL